MRPSSFGCVLLALGALGALAGCAPTTTYRHTAFIPAARPIPFDGRTVKPGQLRVEGTLTSSGVATNLAPQIGDTAALVPNWTVEGSAMIGVAHHVELGLRAAYANNAWAQESAVGTLPVPGSPSSWGIGPEIHLSFPLDKEKRFALGIAGNLVYYQVPYAEWKLEGTDAAGQPVCTTGDSTCVEGYSPVDSGTEGHIVYDLGLYPSYAFGPHGEYGHVVGLVAITSGFRNDGFSNQPNANSTVDSVGPIWMLGGGYGFSYEWLRASALVYKPMTDMSSPVDYGPGVMLTLGVQTDLFAADEEDQSVRMGSAR